MEDFESGGNTVDRQALGVVYRNEFERFSPRLGVVDENLYFGRLEAVAERARKCLTRWTDAEIATIAEFTEWAVTTMFHAGRLHGVAKDGRAMKLTAENIVSSAREVALVGAVCECFMPPRDRVWSLTIEEHSGERRKLDIQAGDIWATCALVLTARAIEFDHSEWLESFGASFAMDAAEAVLAAEIVIAMATKNPSAHDVVKIEISDRGRRAANARWDKLKPVRARAIEIYSSRNWKSRAEAVRRMRDEIEELAREAGQPLSPSHATETITGWLKMAQPKP